MGILLFYGYLLPKLTSQTSKNGIYSQYYGTKKVLLVFLFNGYTLFFHKNEETHIFPTLPWNHFPSNHIEILFISLNTKENPWDHMYIT